MSTVRLYLVRHGRTALNAEGRLRGLANPPLDPVGEAEAATAGDALTGRGIGTLFCSPLARAVRTAAIIGARVGCDAVADPRFTDRDYGPWTGRLRSEVIAEFGSVDAAPGVESSAHVLERVLPALEAVLDTTAETEPRGAAVAVVTHDAVIRPVLAAFGLDHKAETPTGSWAELTRDRTAWQVLSVDN